MNRPVRKFYQATALALLMSAGVTGLFAPALAQAGGQVATQSEKLTLEANKGTLIRLDRPATDIFIANPDVADVQVKSPTLIYVLGRTPGETTLYALDENENTLYSADVVVSRNLARLEESFGTLIPRSNLSVRNVGGMVVIEGNVQSSEEAESAQRYAEAMVGENVINRISVAQPAQVNLRVKIAEVGRSTLKELGFNWDAVYNSTDVFFGVATGAPVFDIVADPVTGLPIKEFLVRNNGASSYVGNLTSGNFDLNTVIDALENEGFVSILAEPNLVAISGETATFLAGGEFPVPVPAPQNQGITVEFREFGVRLAFTPVVMSSGKINLRVAPEVSELAADGSVSVAGITVPALSTRRVTTTVELGSGQSFAIAGLLQNQITQDVSKTPGLSNIPILGALFKSDRFVRDETELVVVVTPYVVRPVSERRLALPTDGLISPSDADRYLRGETLTNRPAAKKPADVENAGPTLVGRAGFKLN